MSASDLLGKIRRYAVGFQQHGVKPGSKVCAHIGNGVENVAAAFGVVFAGGTLVMAKAISVASECSLNASVSIGANLKLLPTQIFAE